jgi:hypothetical protein
MGTMEEQRHEQDGPRTVYNRRLSERRRQLEALERRGRWLGAIKLALVAVAIGVALWFLHVRRADWLLLLPVAAFVLLALEHERVLRAMRTLRAAVGFYERGLAHLDGNWAGKGQTGESFGAADHPYARDLDLFGQGSLFELLCSARTRAGEQTLAGWLLEPAPVAEILRRQQAVRVLSDRLDFRERLFTAGEQVRSGLRPDALLRWAGLTERFGSAAQSALAAVMGLLWVAAVVVAFARGFYLPLLALTLINFALSLAWGSRLEQAATAAEEAVKDLALLGRLLRILENESFSGAESSLESGDSAAAFSEDAFLTGGKLAGLQARLRTDGLAASTAVRRLDRIVFHLEARRNPMLRVFDGLLFYSFHMATWAERWRGRYGGAIGGWLAVVGEMEALCALAGQAFEHPLDAWAEFVESEGALFEAEGLAHPLLPEERAVRNDFALGRGLQLIVLSGPNMAGKSTFIRGLGTNAVLAQCGAPVRAARLRLSPLRVGASICVLDSLQGGVSRFYAEIRRLKLITDLAWEPVGCLFLLDELLSGTNSHDRLAGTEYIVRGLLRRGAIGLVTTHDLALAELPATMGEAARNCHFEDRLEGDRLVFDYQLKPGVVETSNAIRLMQSIGLMGELES